MLAYALNFLEQIAVSHASPTFSDSLSLQTVIFHAPKLNAYLHIPSSLFRSCLTS